MPGGGCAHRESPRGQRHTTNHIEVLMKKSLAAGLLALVLLAGSGQPASAGWFDFTWGNYSFGWNGVNCCNYGWWCCNGCAVVPGPCHVPPQNFYPFYNCNCPRDVTAVYGGWCPPS